MPSRRPRSISPRSASKMPGRALDLVEDDQLVGVVGEVELRLRKPGPVGLGLQVEVHGRPPFGDRQRQRRLADLPRPDQHHGGRLTQERAYFWSNSTGKHPMQIYHCLKDLQGSWGGGCRCRPTPGAFFTPDSSCSTSWKRLDRNSSSPGLWRCDAGFPSRRRCLRPRGRKHRRRLGNPASHRQRPGDKSLSNLFQLVEQLESEYNTRLYGGGSPLPKNPCKSLR